jgi:hypothetical protein
MLASQASAQVAELVSVAQGGGPGNGTSTSPRLSANGRFVLFESTASDLVPLDTNGAGWNLFLRDRLLGTTEIVSRSSNGAQFSGWNGSVSSDGRFVLFHSEDAIEPSDTDLLEDVWRLDRQTGAVELVSLGSDGYRYFDALTSDDGQVVAYELYLLTTSGGNSVERTGFITKHLPSGAEYRFEGLNGSPSQTGKRYGDVRLSADGAWACAVEASFNPDLQAMIRVSTADGAFTYPAFLGGGSSGHEVDSLSADGRYAVASYAGLSMSLWDLQSGSGQLVDLTWNDLDCEPAASSGRLSDDARYVGFRSSSLGMVQGGNSAFSQAYLRDRHTESTLRVGLTGAGLELDAELTDWDATASLDAIVFATAASNVVAGDGNGQSDVFARTNCLVLWPDGDGDGFGAATLGALACLPGPLEVQNTADCDDTNPLISPQGNEICNGVDDDCDLLVDEGQGGTSYCTSKLTSGACLPLITSSGVPSLANPAGFTVTAFGLEDNQNGLQFFGLTGPAYASFFGHILCVNAPLYRLDVKSTAGHGACTGSLSYTLAEVLAQPAGGPLVTAGQFVYQQAWFRDPPAASSFGTSNGLSYGVCP